jgi:CRP/FNR family transcriptional regulator, cyclic AMP receptor protein
MSVSVSGTIVKRASTTVGILDRRTVSPVLAMLNKGPSLEMFRRNILFEHLNDTIIAECAMQFTFVQMHRRQALYRQGDRCSQFYCVVQGSVRASRLTEDGCEFTTRLVGRYDIFGEESLFGDEIFSSTATALSDGIVAVCSASRMASLVRRYPELSINVARCLRAERNRTLDRLEQVASMPVRERLLALLRSLAAQSDGDSGRYEVSLTHLEIASLIGCTRVTVSSQLNKLARAGVLVKRGRKILIDRENGEAA